MSTIAEKLRIKDNRGFTYFGMLLTIGAGITAFLLMLLIPSLLIARWYGATTCTNWASETGIETKFAVLNFADAGTCLAQTPDGRWVLNSKWQAFVDGGKR